MRYYRALVFLFSFVLSLSALGKTIHSFSNPEHMKVEHTDLKLEINFDKKIFSGTATLRVKRLQGTKLILDTNMLTIKSVSGDALAHELGTAEKINPRSTEEFGAPLVITTKDQDVLNIIIEYETSPAAPGIAWLNGNQTKSGEPFVYSMNEPVGARSEFPCQDTPSVRGTYSASLTVVASEAKEPLLALASNVTNNYRKASKEMRYENLTSTVPIPSYLFVIAAGRLLWAEQDQTIGYYAETQKTLDDALSGFKNVPRYFAILKKMFGDSPWARQDFIFLPAMFAFGGMENPMLIYINEGLVESTGASSYVMAHELAHMWTGNLVTNEYWKGFWINEAFTTFAEYLVLCAVYGEDFGEGNLFESFLELIAAEKERLDKPRLHSQPTLLHKKQKMDGKEIHPDELTEFSVYSKGAIMLENIRRIIGNEAMANILRTYISDFTFTPINNKTLTPYYAKKLSQEKSDIDWENYLKEWILKPGMHPKFEQESIKNIWLPQVQKSQEKLKDFAEQGEKTDFNNWNRFQILELLKTLEQDVITAKEENSRNQAVEQVKKLFNSNLVPKITPIADIRSKWYQLLVRSDLWQPKQEEIRAYLSYFGRGRLIRPLYVAFKETKGKKELEFAKDIFNQNKERYFPCVNSGISKVLFQ